MPKCTAEKKHKTQMEPYWPAGQVVVRTTIIDVDSTDLFARMMSAQHPAIPGALSHPDLAAATRKAPYWLS